MTTLRTDGLMAEVTIELAGGQQLVSVITRASAEALGLREGDTVTAVIKSTEVMVAR
jgi:molybdopterin-binding protein